MTTMLRERDVAGVCDAVERRDLTTRALRSMVAAWCDIHPRSLAALTSDTVDRMAGRLEGRRLGGPQDGDGGATAPLGHPWAG